MSNICYYYNHGILCATWPGKSTYVASKGSRKKEQLYLGKVINKEKLIFWTKARGYYIFDPVTGSFAEPPPEAMPQAFVQPDGRRRYPPVIVDFGDSFFLDQFIRGIKYDEVLECIGFKNRDSFYALLSFYTLENAANCHAESWLYQNYASYLYPKANLASQRISDLLTSLGRDNQVREFLARHIAYVIGATNDDISVIIDSSGFENKCNIPITQYNNHNGEKRLEFRMIAVVQKSTGIPLYYECIPGNIVDVSTLDRVILTLSQYNCNVQYCIGDAGYCCPSTIERLILSGIDFMTRINPHFNIYKKVVDEHFDELYDDNNIIRYKNRFVHIVKVESIIGKDNLNGEDKIGYIYLCKDIQSSNSKTDHLLSSNKIKNMTTDDVVKAKKRFGVFAIISTRNVSPQEILPEYYVRQSVEQYFDFGKNYANYLPVRQHNMDTLNGHLLLSFISVFFIILIKNRLNVVDCQYTCIPEKIIKKENLKSIEKIDTDIANDEWHIVLQDPLKEVFRESPSTLFKELRGQKADIHPRAIIPTVATHKANQFYESFGLLSPRQIHRNGDNLEVEYKKEPNGHTKILTFSFRPCISDNEIIEKMSKKLGSNHPRNTETSQYKTEENKEISTEINKKRLTSHKNNDKLTDNKTSKKTNISTTEKQSKRSVGRPPGSKNKKTLEREAMIAAGLITKPPKRPVGRPPGSRNKKTLEGEAKAVAESQPDHPTDY